MKIYIIVYTQNVWVIFVFHIHNIDGLHWLQLHLVLGLHGVHVHSLSFSRASSALNTANTWKDALAIGKPEHPAAGKPYRKPCVAAPVCLSSPLELGRAPSATEQASSLHRPSEDGRRTAQPCTRAQLPETREQSLPSLTGPQKRGGAEGGPPGCPYPNRLFSTARAEASPHLLPTSAVATHRRPERRTSMPGNTHPRSSLSGRP